MIECTEGQPPGLSGHAVHLPSAGQLPVYKTQDHAENYMQDESHYRRHNPHTQAKETGTTHRHWPNHHQQPGAHAHGNTFRDLTGTR